MTCDPDLEAIALIIIASLFIGFYLGVVVNKSPR